MLAPLSTSIEAVWLSTPKLVRIGTFREICEAITFKVTSPVDCKLAPVSMVMWGVTEDTRAPRGFSASSVSELAVRTTLGFTQMLPSALMSSPRPLVLIEPTIWKSPGTTELVTTDFSDVGLMEIVPVPAMLWRLDQLLLSVLYWMTWLKKSSRR